MKEYNAMEKTSAFVAAALAALAISGCASGPAIDAAVRPGTAAATNPHMKALVSVREVTGPAETDSYAVWAPIADANTFRRALQDSLALNGYYISNPALARFAISANIDRFDQPRGGFNMTVNTAVTYQVSGPGGSKKIAISTTGTATPNDSISAAERLRIANERAIRDNIRQLLEQLSTMT